MGRENPYTQSPVFVFPVHSKVVASRKESNVRHPLFTNSTELYAKARQFPTSKKLNSISGNCSLKACLMGSVMGQDGHDGAIVTIQLVPSKVR